MAKQNELPSRDSIARMGIYLGEACMKSVGNLTFYQYKGDVYGFNRSNVYRASDFGEYKIIRSTLEYVIEFV